MFFSSFSAVAGGGGLHFSMCQKTYLGLNSEGRGWGSQKGREEALRTQTVQTACWSVEKAESPSILKASCGASSWPCQGASSWVEEGEAPRKMALAPGKPWEPRGRAGALVP